MVNGLPCRENCLVTSSTLLIVLFLFVIGMLPVRVKTLRCTATAATLGSLESLWLIILCPWRLCCEPVWAALGCCVIIYDSISKLSIRTSTSICTFLVTTNTIIVCNKSYHTLLCLRYGPRLRRAVEHITETLSHGLALIVRDAIREPQ